MLRFFEITGSVFQNTSNEPSNKGRSFSPKILDLFKYLYPVIYYPTSNSEHKSIPFLLFKWSIKTLEK